nr:MAG TPA: hypothetical protein [Microviridae sp.]DAO48251.1 MAG TPA: hypothetical protein [Microviridae sp.]DAP59918.1 MAG TPA: hypothetical protein [Microviridae sp.]DAW86919.1 MAG TPA: hypothetical protein [Microviridae sp.]DAW97230.1 MAG TPA: hypothetical protein [Microviridae sp.]
MVSIPSKSLRSPACGDLFFQISQRFAHGYTPEPVTYLM